MLSAWTSDLTDNRPVAWLSVDAVNCGKGKDHVYYEKGVDQVARNCEEKHRL
jgi:hypothetical protein